MAEFLKNTQRSALRRENPFLGEGFGFVLSPAVVAAGMFALITSHGQTAPCNAINTAAAAAWLTAPACTGWAWRGGVMEGEMWGPERGNVGS